MSYAPIELVPLQDLSSAATPDTVHEDDTDTSSTSEVFADIDHYAKTNGDPEQFHDDPSFQAQLRKFTKAGNASRKICALVFLVCFGLWAVALAIYSNGNARRAASTLWHGTDTNLVLLANRNLSLNAYDPKHANVTMRAYRTALFMAPTKMVRWLLPAQFPKTLTDSSRGFYLTSENSQYIIRQADSTYRRVMLESNQFEYENNFFYAKDLQLNPGESVDNRDAWHLVMSDSTLQWRHSSFSLYWIWQPISGEIIPIQPPSHTLPDELELLHFAHFDPSGTFIVYGYAHNLYIMTVADQKTIQITTDGSPNIFNGKPDWVYEEEIYPFDNMIWWSPDLKQLVYASIDDTGVSEYKIEYYVKDPGEVAMSYEDGGPEKIEGVNQYPVHSGIKYPKPGSKNPTVALFSYDVEQGKSTLIEDLADGVIGDDFVLYDVRWIDNENLLLKLADRNSKIQRKKLASPKKSSKVSLVSTTNTTEFGGWIEKSAPIVLVMQEGANKYLDRVVVDNVVQLALFDLAGAELYSKLLGPVNYLANFAYDAMENCVYGMFGTDLNSSFAAVSLTDLLKKVIAEGGKFEASFSSDAHFVDLKYKGPDQPWQKLVNMALWHLDSISIPDLDPIDDGKRLSQVLAQTNIPTRAHTTVKVGHGKDQVELNVIEIFPPNFNPKEKHPLLVHAYGGPGSHIVDYAFLVDFQDIVSSQLNAVVLILEPRGTGSDNWKLKSYATGNIGYWEPRDITSITKDYIKTNKYVDDRKTAIWGWSYGGFTTLKTLEFDHGEVFHYGMAVAPVTNWLFYDSMYTERYMNQPSENKNYKAMSRINEFENFGKVDRFLIMHGTADDNVHLQNSMWLMDNFDVKNIENYDVHFFPDSDHSIYYHNAFSVVYDKLLWWLERAFMGYYN